MKKKLFYIHGFRSGPEKMNPKTENIRKFAEENGYEFHEPNMHWETQGTAVLDQLVDSIEFLQRVEPSKLMFVGTSLGGAAALYLNSLFHPRADDTKFRRVEHACLAINPPVSFEATSFSAMRDEFEALPQLKELNEYYNFESHEESRITREHLRQFEKMFDRIQNFYRHTYHQFYTTVIVVGEKDKIVEPRPTVEFAQDCGITYAESMTEGHSFCHTSDGINLLRWGLGMAKDV